MSGGHGPESAPRLDDGYDDDKLVGAALAAMYEYAGPEKMLIDQDEDDADIMDLDDAVYFLGLWRRHDELDPEQEAAVLNRIPRLPDTSDDDD